MFALLEKELAYSFVWRMHDPYLKEEEREFVLREMK
jgi:hypothetical protein